MTKAPARERHLRISSVGMEFPLKPDFFPPVRLTSDDRQRYVATAEYSVHVLRKLVMDDNWKRISETKGVTVGKVHCIEEQPHGTGSAAARACLIMCATAFATGSVSEVLEAIASPVTDDYRRAMSFLYKDRFIDGVCLHTISPRGSRNTQAFTTIKWAAFKDGIPLASAPKPHNPLGIDYCFLEHSGIQRDADRDEAFGFCIQESVTRDSEVPVMAGFGMSRGELHRTGILVLPTDRKDLVQISSVLQMDTASALTKSALEKLMIRRVTAVARIPLLLDRRRMSRMQFLPRENWVRDQERRVCAVCTKTFGLRRKHHCRNCGEVVCGTCAPPREVDISSYGVASIRICTACVVQSRSNGTHNGAQQDDVLVYHVHQTLSSQAGSSNSVQSHQSDYDIGDDLGPGPRNSSSSDSNFSISSNDDDDERRRTHRHYEQDAYDYEQDEYGYEHYDPVDCGDSQYEQYEAVGRDISIVGGAPHELDETPMRYSDFSECSSGLSFSDFNSLHDDTLRITSVTTNKGAQHQLQTQQPPVEGYERRRHVPVVYYQPEEKPVKHMLYTPLDLENNAPNQPPREPRASMDEWFAPRMHHQPQYVEQSRQPEQRNMASKRATPEYLDEWSSLRPPSNANSHTSTASTVTRESMDDWFGGRRRERNLSHVSSTSTASGGSRNGGLDSKRSSSSASSSSSILDMLSSIREIQADLASVHHTAGKPKDVRRQHEQFSLERLSEQLREAEVTVAPVRTSGRPPVGARPGNRSSEQSTRSGSTRSASTVDIDLLNSDSFSLICPDTLQRQQFTASTASQQHQDAGERRSARTSNLSTSTVLEDVDDVDSMRQSELMSLRMQVEGLHKSLEDATTKLNYFTARAMVREQADTLEREVMELRTTERRQRKLSDAVDPVVVDRKKQYHALIEELHEIMGLPALSTHPRGDELP